MQCNEEADHADAGKFHVLFGVCAFAAVGEVMAGMLAVALMVTDTVDNGNGMSAVL